MIDTTQEELLKLAEAAKLLPKLRRGRNIHVSTLYRWTTRGYRGVRLDCVQVGSTRCTSREALARFVAALSEKAGRLPAAMPARSKAKDRAARRLREHGIDDPNRSRTPESHLER